MTELLDQIEEALADLFRSGLDTGAPAAAARLQALAQRCEDTGLHTGAALLARLARDLAARAHTLQKEDLPLADTICRLTQYCALCREKAQEDAIARRWHDRPDTEPTGAQR